MVLQGEGVEFLETSSQSSGASGQSTEFDRFAAEYERIHNATFPPGVKSRDFLVQKAELVSRLAQERFRSSEGLSILDFGCGTGRLLSLLADAPWCKNLAGVDESAASLEEAHRHLQGASKSVCLARTVNDLGSKERYDLVLMFNVLHHVPLGDRGGIIAQVVRRLKAGGRVMIWEHNPFNLLTRLVVALSPLDANAHLLSRHSLERLVQRYGLCREQSRYVNCFPPRWGCLRMVGRIEEFLSAVPLGTQYWALFGSSTA